MNIPHSRLQQSSVSSFPVLTTTQYYNAYPWDISVIAKTRRGERAMMEDRVWFKTPPFVQDDTVYLQCFVLDGHSTHPIELERLFFECQQQCEQPINEQTISEWQKCIDEKEETWIQGGVVIHLVSISFRIHTPNTLHIYRCQIGDCNSVVFTKREVIIPLMYQHNIQQFEEFSRVSKWIQNGRVGGVLQCTRVIGDKTLKDRLNKSQNAPEDLLKPIWLCENYTMKTTEHSGDVFICLGSDGVMQPSSLVDSNLRNIQDRLMSTSNSHETLLSDMWMNSVSQMDNTAIIMIRMRWVGF